MEEEYKGMTVREAGRKGGEKVRDKYEGTDFYSRIGKLGGQRTAQRYGNDYLSEIGMKGGRKRAEQCAENEE